MTGEDIRTATSGPCVSAVRAELIARIPSSQQFRHKYGATDSATRNGLEDAELEDRKINLAAFLRRP